MVNIMVEFQCCNKLKAVAGGLTKPFYNVCSKVLHIKGSQKDARFSTVKNFPDLRSDEYSSNWTSFMGNHVASL